MKTFTKGNDEHVCPAMCCVYDLRVNVVPVQTNYAYIGMLSV
jgi:hypothetical protein